MAGTSPSSSPPLPVVTHPHFLADLYSFNWTGFSFKLPLVSASTVALCLAVGILAGHPGGALIAAGGAFTVGFGANQRIADSRLIPMIAAVLGVAAATLVGTLAGHRNGWLILAAGISALAYGLLTTRHTGLAWVGQQASVALLVASAYPTGPRPALERAGLLIAGGVAQVVITSAGLRLIPNLRSDLVWMAESLFRNVHHPGPELLNNFRRFPQVIPALPRDAAFGYCVRLIVTMCAATEIYRQSGVQSGYWIPMTALLVQKPAFFETLTRATLRIFGTLLGAWLCSLLIAHLVPSPFVIAAMTTFFALLAFATNSVNYGLFSACLTAYIVFLLSLNQIPDPLIAHRRAWCTIAGGLIALAIHADALRRLRAHPAQPEVELLKRAS